MQRGRLELLLGESRALQTAYAMRDELMALWERSNVSGEHLLKALQDWCERAENSGVRQLQELSLRLRSYVLA
jgi:stearoyl-CoA desaturase (delta-9 desaturase)